jgi:hypothetical protein
VGTDEVRLEHSGFTPYHHAGVVLSLGQTIHLDIVLSAASASEEVTVRAQASAIDTMLKAILRNGSDAVN